MFSFWRASLVTLVVGLLLSMCAMGAVKLFLHFGFEIAWAKSLAGITSALLVIILVIALEKRMSGKAFLESAKSLGFKSIARDKWTIVLLGCIPLLAAYAVLILGMKRSPVLVPLFPMVLLKFLLSQGIGEEIVFRGFIFQKLRAGRSFYSAAFLSAVLFSVVHLANFVHGFSMQLLVGVAISMAFAFLLSFPMAALFEVCGSSILGLAVWHVVIDSLNFFQDLLGETSLPMVIYLSGVALSAALMLWLCHKKLAR